MPDLDTIKFYDNNSEKISWLFNCTNQLHCIPWSMNLNHLFEQRKRHDAQKKAYLQNK